MAMLFGRKSLRNKKGSVQDAVFIMGFLLMVTIGILIGFKVVTEFNSNVQSNDAFDADAKAISNRMEGIFPGVLDNMFLFLMIGLSLAAIILAAMVRVHPVFMILFFIILVVIIILAGVFSNVYQELAANPSLSTQADQLTFISIIMNFLPFIIGIIGFIIMIVMYKIGGANE